jgi:hypothetical protein
MRTRTMNNALVRAGRVLLGTAILSGTCLSAAAATIDVNSHGGGDGGERCLVSTGAKCSGGSYDNALSLISIFENDLGAGITLVRVDDSSDKIWMNATSNSGEVRAIARYASDNSELGFDSGNGFTFLTGPLANNQVSVNSALAFAGDNHTGDFVITPDSWTTIPVPAWTPFAFVLNDESMNYMISSNRGSGVASAGYENSDNLNLDYMVTFQVRLNGVAQQDYFIAWEDRDPRIGNTGDYDYNDFIAEVRFADPVPEPEIYAMLAAGLGLMGFVGRRRKQKETAAA